MAFASDGDAGADMTTDIHIDKDGTMGTDARKPRLEQKKKRKTRTRDD